MSKKQFDFNMAHETSHEHTESKNLFGFWIYIMSDCMLFAALFATFIVLKDNTFGLSNTQDLFSLPYILTETMILLTSSFTFGLGTLAYKNSQKRQAIFFFVLTLLLGIAFLTMEINEFHHLISLGATPQKNAFLSSFFTLVGTHGLHVFAGSIWLLLVIIQINIHGIHHITKSKIFCLGLFWHFLDIIWIFVFTIVYLMNAI